MVSHMLRERGKSVDVGWLLDASVATFIWYEPVQLKRERPAAESAKGVYNCPAVMDHEARLFEVKCPVDLHLRLERDGETGAFRIWNPMGDQASMTPGALKQICTLGKPNEWRHPERPIIQVITPYYFLSDDPVYIAQFPPFGDFRTHAWPGLMIGGRLPINVWVRNLTWAFEWHDPSRDLVIQRGAPWFYVRFETNDLTRHVRLYEAELTSDLRDYIGGARGVTNFVGRTFSLFSTALQRRPRRLLVRKART